MVSFYTYNGTNLSDTLNTQQIADTLASRTDGITINGFAGDDNLTITIIGEARSDQINAGPGNDFLAADARFTGFAAATLSGDQGSDYVYLPFRIDSFTNVEAGIEVRGITQDGSPIIVLVGRQNEVISNELSNGQQVYYLVEDLWAGRVRTVSWEEVYARAYNGNEDWFLRGLDTYSSYNRSKNSGQPSLPPVAENSEAPSTYDVLLGSTGRWIKKSKTRRDDLRWGSKGVGKKRKFLIDNSVTDLQFFDIDNDSLRISGFRYQDTVIQSYRGSDTLLRMGNNIIARFQGLDFNYALERGFRFI